MTRHLGLIGVLSGALLMTAGSSAHAQAVPNNTCNCTTASSSANGNPPVTICLFNQSGGATQVLPPPAAPNPNCDPIQENPVWLSANPPALPSGYTPLDPADQVVLQDKHPDRYYYIDSNNQLKSVNILINGVAVLGDQDAGMVNPVRALPSPLGPYQEQDSHWESGFDAGLS
jgi:hypothetical protein